MTGTRPVSLVSSLLLLFCAAEGQHRTIDFRYSPQASFTAICLPDDWQKTVVTNSGALGYDFGPGPYAKPLTEVSVGVQGTTLHVERQYLRNSRIPVVTTELSGNGVAVRQQALAIVPDTFPRRPPARPSHHVKRIGGLTGCIGWASPPENTDPAFRNVAWGTNRPIRYVVIITPGSKKKVALGICESYRTRPAMRALELRVEGAASLIFDQLLEGAQNRPRVVLFNARDTNKDGNLSIDIVVTGEAVARLSLTVGLLSAGG